MTTSGDGTFTDNEKTKLCEDLIGAIGQFDIDHKKVESLLQQGADPFYVGENGRSAYLESARSSHLKWVKYFLQQGADLNLDVPGTGLTVFLCCTQKCDLEFLKHMLTLGADIHTQSSDNKNAVFYASQPWANRMEKIKWLNEQGVDLDSPDKRGRTPLYEACASTDLELVSYFLSKGCNPDPIDTRNKLTPLIKAVESGSADIVAVLLKAGADPKMKNLDRKTCYQVALDEGFQDIAKLINNDDAESDYKNSGLEETVKKIQLNIILALKNGAHWTSFDRETGSNLWYEKGKYHYYCKDTYSEEDTAKITSFFQTDDAALEWLYNENKRTSGVNTMEEVYQLILRKIS